MVRSFYLKKRNKTLMRVMLAAKSLGFNNRYVRDYTGGALGSFSRNVGRNVNKTTTTVRKNLNLAYKNSVKWFKAKRRKLSKASFYKEFNKGTFFTNRFKAIRKWSSGQMPGVQKAFSSTFTDSKKWVNKRVLPKMKTFVSDSYSNVQLMIAKVA